MQARDGIDPIAQMDFGMKFYKKNNTVDGLSEGLEPTQASLYFFLVLSVSGIMITFKDQMIQKQVSEGEMNLVIFGATANLPEPPAHSPSEGGVLNWVESTLYIR